MKSANFNKTKEIIKLATPIAFFNSTTILASLIIGFFLAKLGFATLAAGALISVTQTSLMMICSAPLFAVSTIVSRMHSENQHFKIGKLMQQSYIFALILAIPVIIIMLTIKIILTLLGQEDEIVILAGLYFDSYLWGVPASMLLTCSQQFLLGIKKTYFLTLIGVIGLFFTLFFSYSLAFGAYGFPEMGVYGLGAAQSIRSWLLLFLLTCFVYINEDFAVFNLKDISQLGRLTLLKKVFSLGWPISIHAASEFFALFAIAILVGKLGSIGLSAQHISSQYTLIVSIFFLGVSQSSNLLVSSSIGNQCRDNVENYGYIGIILSIVIGAVAVLITLLFSDKLIGLYIDINDKATVDTLSIIRPFFVTMMFWQLLEGVKATCTATLRALYDTKIPMILSVIGKWGIVVPLAYFTTNKLGWGINSIGAAHIIGSGFCTLLLFERWRVFSFNMSYPQHQPKVIFYRLLHPTKSCTDA